jgi:hypothetical protein
MALVINGTVGTYLSTTTLPPSSIISFSAFVNIQNAAVGRKHVIFTLTNAVGADGTQSRTMYMYQDSATFGHITYENPFGTVTSNFPNATIPIANNTWVFVAYSATLTGNNNTVYWKYAGGPGFTTATNGVADTAFTPAWLAIGSDSTGSGSVVQGSIASVRVWNGSLTAADFELESQCLEPYRTADLWADWRFDSDLDLTDHVRSNTLTATNAGNISQGSNPPIPERHILGVV